ncbi:MAG: VanZ family protein [Prevotella sp.]|nr:VanZ family protein [Prevotella sp.]
MSLSVFQYVRRYPLSLVCLLLLFLLSFVPLFEDTPLNDINFIDKWTHFVMYGGTTSVVWWEYLRSHSRIDYRRLLTVTIVAMVVLGGVIELLQAYCTTTRSGEWADFLADVVGVLLGNGIGLILKQQKIWLKRR